MADTPQSLVQATIRYSFWLLYLEKLNEGVYLGVDISRAFEVKTSTGDARHRKGVSENLFGNMTLARFANTADRQIAIVSRPSEQRAQGFSYTAVIRQGPIE